jgi:hypothetical protein
MGSWLEGHRALGAQQGVHPEAHPEQSKAGRRSKGSCRGAVEELEESRASKRVCAGGCMFGGLIKLRHVRLCSLAPGLPCKEHLCVASCCTASANTVVPQLSKVLRDEDVIGVICVSCGPVVVTLTSSASLCGNVGKPITFICVSISLYRFR